MSKKHWLGFVAVLIFLVSCLSYASGRPKHRQRGNAVTDWNVIALQVLPVDPGLLRDSRAFAIMHAAIHDAVNGIDRRYQPYTADLSSPGASVDAAIAAAAHDVLVALSPSQSTTIEIAYAAALVPIGDGPAKDAGIALGRESARANLARRASDGADSANEPPSTPTGEPGDYDFTAPFDGPPLGPVALFSGWGRVTPFGIRLDEHQLPGLDTLTSQKYARDFNFVKNFGSADSSSRTADQTELALFWFEFSPMWIRIATTILQAQNLDVWRTARILALVNFALADGYIAGFDAKYQFRFWRPITAIRRADEDNNPATTADKDWLPLLATRNFFIPPVPEYPSVHAVLGAAVATVLIDNFGDHVPFVATSGTAPGVVRRFKSFTQAAKENGMSRVFGGIHFLHAVNDGYRQGQSIGRAVSRLLPSVHGQSTPK